MRPTVRCAVAIIALCLSFSCHTFAQSDTSTSSNYQPIVMLTEHNPWLMVAGSDSPSFVLYRNGTVIYVKGKMYLTAKLSKDDTDILLRELDLSALESLKDSYSWSGWTDQPDNVLVFQTGDTRKKISVYGNLRSSPPLAQPPEPANLYYALQRLVKFDNATAVEWKPDFIEVMVWPFGYAKGKPAIWPSKWPGLSDATTVRRGSIFSLFIPESESKELTDFLTNLKPTQAVLIENRKYAISTRWPFPHEHQPQRAAKNDAPSKSTSF